MTGELDPPANPLICPQFCVRFNDLDNIGITGRHYSGFIMLGIQVFNYPGKYHYFKEECTEFNYNWLVQELGISPDEITFIEDVWAGGGNCGPCIEYFVGGLEVGDMVFTQFKTYHDGTLEELPTTVIDTGIGLERIPWLINGTATSYMDTFKHSFGVTAKKLGFVDSKFKSGLSKVVTNIILPCFVFSQIVNNFRISQYILIFQAVVGCIVIYIFGLFVGFAIGRILGLNKKQRDFLGAVFSTPHNTSIYVILIQVIGPFLDTIFPRNPNMVGDSEKRGLLYVVINSIVANNLEMELLLCLN